MKIVILGAGVIGVTSAWYLSRAATGRKPDPDQARRSKRSASITLTQAETKSQTNFSRLSSWA